MTPSTKQASIIIDSAGKDQDKENVFDDKNEFVLEENDD